MTGPVFTHDCDVCRFLGHEQGCDLYVCGADDSVSVVARYGSFGPDYASQSVDLLKSTMGEPAGSTRKLLRRAVELAGVQS